MTQFSRRSALLGGIAAGAAIAGTGLPDRQAQAAAPAADSSNGGWFRYKVGEFQVTVVADGVGTTPLPDFYVGGTPKAEVNKALEAMYLPKDKTTHAYTPIVINTGSKLVVVDTGLGLGTFAQSKGALGQFQHNLKASGIDANAVDVVIISHFHGDHINGLVTPDNKPMFPNAEVMVPEVEWAFWMDETNASKLPQMTRPQMNNPKRVFGALGNKVTKYQGTKELVPGITSMFTPGHTHGHHSFMVSSGSSRVLVQSDVSAGMAALFVAHPDWKFGADSDPDLGAQTRHKVYDMAAADRVLVQGFHFGFPGTAYVEKAGDGYRLVPVSHGQAV